MRRRILKTYGWILGVGLLYYGIVVTTGFSLGCAFLRTTGLQCPGCGISRMFLALSRLDLRAAFQYHPVGLILLGVWNLAALLGVLEKPGFVCRPLFWTVLFYTSVGGLVIFGLARNFC